MLVSFSSCSLYVFITPTERILVPPEIKRLGREEEYLKALKDGEEKIPYCGLLILGEKGVGKTSLYRQLAGMKFDVYLKSTEGIDKNTVDIVDRRSFNIDKGVWQEIGSDAGERYGDAVMNNVVPKLLLGVSENCQIESVVEEVELLEQVHQIVAQTLSPVPDLSHPTESRLPPPKKAVPVPRQLTPPPKKAVPVPRCVRTQARQLTPPPEEDSFAYSGMLNRRQCKKIGDYVKGKQPFQKKEPSLVLNVLDFAGEIEYRLIHHCYITRRALYVVVFKVPDMLDDGRKSSAIKEIQYWIHSIHAHIYPPDETVKRQDEAINRVFLVGTHRGERALSEREFKKINELIYCELICDSHCANHIYPLELPSYGKAFFIPVENSIDVTHEEYLVESGIKYLQDEIKNVYEDPERLPSLHEYYPIKWLHFEQDLKLMSNARNPPIVKMEEVEKIYQIGVKEIDEAFKPATWFFHDTGKFSFLSELAYSPQICTQLLILHNYYAI